MYHNFDFETTRTRVRKTEKWTKENNIRTPWLKEIATSCRPQMGPCWPHEPCYQGYPRNMHIVRTLSSFVVFHFMVNFTHVLKNGFTGTRAIHDENSQATGEFPAQRPVTRSFDVFFDLRLNKRLSKQWWGWWFETPPSPLWCHCNVVGFTHVLKNYFTGTRAIIQLPWYHWNNRDD